LTNTNGSYYDGEWENDLKHGKGKITYTNGLCYDGEWKHGLKHGKGKITNINTNGLCYDGEWCDNKVVLINIYGTTNKLQCIHTLLQK
jgi:hypothetical protein